MEKLSDPQRQTLGLWAERTRPGEYHYPEDVFSARDNTGNAHRRNMRTLAGLGLVATDGKGRLAGGNPFASGQPTPPPPPWPAPRPSPPPAHEDLEPEPAPWDDPPPSRNGNGAHGERPAATRLYSYLTKTTFLHLEDALEIGKVKLFAGQYARGQGASVTAYHYMDAPDLRVLLFDLLHGVAELEYTEFKGSASGESGPVSRVLKIKRDPTGKTWWRLENGPGAVIGEGAIKPAGEPAAVVNVPMDPRQVKRLVLATRAYLDAWQTAALLRAGRSEHGGGGGLD